MWLGGANEVQNFKFQWPGAHHHARFMGKELYILKMDLLKDQLSFLTVNEKDQISQLAIFTALYQAIWFLQCNVAVSAPYSTLQCFDQMVKFTEFNLHLAFTICDILVNHTWYLSESWVVVSLVDEDCPEEERRAVADQLLANPRP